MKEENCVDEIEGLWQVDHSDIFEKFKFLQIGIIRCAVGIRQKKEGRKKLIEKIKFLLDQDKTDESMADLIDTRVHFNLEIYKDEMYWENRAQVNWLKLGDKNT